MRDIYKLSNENRQRNKEKKKTKEPSESLETHHNSTSSAFMAKIGWTAETAPAYDYKKSIQVTNKPAQDYFNPYTEVQDTQVKRNNKFKGAGQNRSFSQVSHKR